MFIHHSKEPELSARLLMATPKSTLQLVDISSSQSMKVIHTFSHDSIDRFVMEDCVHLMDCSSDGQLAVVADHKSNIVVVDLKSFKVHATLPRYKSHPTALAFNPSSHLLVVSYADHKIVEYDVANRQYTPFSKKLSEHLPVQWLSRSCAVRHITFDVRHPDVIILHDDSVIYTIDKNKVNRRMTRAPLAVFQHIMLTLLTCLFLERRTRQVDDRFCNRSRWPWAWAF